VITHVSDLSCQNEIFKNPDSRPVLLNLCAVAHLCAARAVEVCRGRMAEIKSFQ